MTTLIKLTGSVYSPGTPGSPGSPGTIDAPGYYAYVTTYVGTWTRADGVVYGTPGSNASLSSGGGLPWTYSISPVTTLTYFPPTTYSPPQPAIPAIPAGFIADYNLGWSGRASSIAPLTGDGYFSFNIPTSDTGVVVGLSPAPQTSGFADIMFGFYSSHGVASIYESGISVFSYGAHTSTSQFAVRRRAGKVDYLVDGAVVFSSAFPAFSSTVFLTAALYSGGDSVINAALVLENGGAASMQPLASTGRVTSYAAGNSYVSMQPLTSVAYSISSYAVNSMSALDSSASGGQGYGYALASMVAPTSFSTGLTTPSYALSKNIMDYPVASAHGFTGTNGSTAASLLPLSSYASVGASSSAIGSMLPLSSFGYDPGTPNLVNLFSGAGLLTQLTSMVNTYVVMNSSGLLTGILTVKTEVTGQINSSATASGTLVPQQVLQAILSSIAKSSSLSFDDSAPMAWVINTKNSGTTRYNNYGFNSYAKIGQYYYGVKNDGIYRLNGASDAGTPIAASINFGKTDFGTSMLKSLTNCYIGVASSGAMVLKVVADGSTYYYTARGNSTNLETQRIDVGRGFRANYFELELQNPTAGGAFELASIEFTPIPLSRRI